jgi:putative hydrolase of the HAD superfamily
MGLIFDMGGVLSLAPDIAPAMAETMRVPLEPLRGFTRAHIDALTTGAESTAEFWRALNGHFGTDQQEDLLVTLFRPVIDAKVEQLIRDLKAAGRRVVCGTNTFEGHYGAHVRNGDYGVFDAVYASHLMGVAKPSAKFFEYILVREGWQPEDTFFIDDARENVDAAARLGIRSFLYASLPALKAWLAAELRPGSS